jgi:hypothetical protein
MAGQWCGVVCVGGLGKGTRWKERRRPAPSFLARSSPLCCSIRIMIGGREEERDATTTTAATPHQTPDKAREGARHFSCQPPTSQLILGHLTRLLATPFFFLLLLFLLLLLSLSLSLGISHLPLFPVDAR